jgi:hypothetical protein
MVVSAGEILVEIFGRDEVVEATLAGLLPVILVVIFPPLLLGTVEPLPSLAVLAGEMLVVMSP